MPILTKGEKRLYFVHIPFSIGPGFYAALHKAGYEISNLGPKGGNLAKATEDEFAQSLVKNAGITSLPVYGEVEDKIYPLQFAPAKDWAEWGPFHDAFAIILPPEGRFGRLIDQLYRIHLAKEKTVYSKEHMEAFFEKKLEHYLFERVRKRPQVFGGQFRRCSEFLLPQVKHVPFGPKGDRALTTLLGDVDWKFPAQVHYFCDIPERARTLLDEFYGNEEELYLKAQEDANAF